MHDEDEQHRGYEKKKEKEKQCNSALFNDHQ
jgi:hypothetical protein